MHIQQQPTAVNPSGIVEDMRLWRDSELENTELLRAVCRSHRYAAHYHDEYVIAVFERGAQRHSIARHPGIAVPGSVMIIPPGEVHTGEAEKEAGMWAYRALYPAAEVVQKVAEQVFACGLAGIDFGREALREDPAVARQLMAAHQLIETSPDALERQASLLEILALLITHYGQPLRQAVIADLPEADIRQALELIHSCFHQPLKIAQVADAAGLSEYHFMRSFRKKTGMTVHGYINQLRLRTAKQRLAQGMSAAETALSVGFFDQSHFTNRFRASFGVTPKKYVEASR